MLLHMAVIRERILSNGAHDRIHRADLEAGGAAIQKIAKWHSVSVGTVQRIKAELTAAPVA